MKSIDILGLGCAAVDDLIFVEAYPPPDAKTRVARRERHCGGLTATALVAAARLGAKCAFAGALGSDDLSRFVLDCLQREGIDITGVHRNPQARPIYSNIVVDQRRGTRNIFYDLDHVVGPGNQIPSSLIESCRVLFVDNIGPEGIVRAARIARQAGIPVVGDFESSPDPQLRELLHLTNHLIISSAFAQQLTRCRQPRQAIRKLIGEPYEVVVVTQGAEGCWFWNQGWPEPEHQPAFKVEAVDTTGCGDAFHGAYAFGLVQGMTLSERIRLASAAAALKVTQPGGQAGIPTLPQVRAFLKKERLPSGLL